MAMLRRSVDLDVSERRHDVAIRVPCKKMKKRRELDALVAKSQKSLSSVYKSGGYPPGPHGPLLRNDSDSCSDLEGYPSVGSPKHQSACCKSSRSGMWVPAWLFLIVLIGTVVSATLLWLHIGLKQDFILLRNHLVKVDVDGKHIPDSIRDMEQRLAHMRVNQSRIEQLVGQLSSQLDRINRHLELVNGSAEELRTEISNTIEKQMPAHLEKLNASLAEVQAGVTRVADGLLSTNEQLNHLSSKQKQSEETIRFQGSSIATIEDAISGKNTSSSLARSLNSTVEDAIRKAQARIESLVERAQSEMHAQMSSSLNDSIMQMKREITSLTPTEMKSMPLVAINTDSINANNGDRNNNQGTSVDRDEKALPRKVSNVSGNPTTSLTTSVGNEVTTRSPPNTLSTMT